MPDKYQIIVANEKKPVYSGDNVIVAAIVYRSSVRASAFDPKSSVACQDVSFYAEGVLLEQYQPLRKRM